MKSTTATDLLKMCQISALSKAQTQASSAHFKEKSG
jgi:hypothetical protein